jgi:chromosome segregation ATPase
MATNGMEIAVGLEVEEQILRFSKNEQAQPTESPERAQARKRAIDYLASDSEPLRAGDFPDPVESGEKFALAPLVNKIAFSMARGLAVALKELEHHIAGETKRVAEVVDRRFDSLQGTLQGVSDFMAAQRATNAAVDARLEQLASAVERTDARRAADVDGLRHETNELSAAVAEQIEVSAVALRDVEARQAAKVESLRAESTEMIGSIAQRLDAATVAQKESDARNSEALSALENQTKAFSQSMSEKIDNILKELVVHQEDISAIKESLCSFSTRVQALVERLDRQADTVRSMCSAYSQRELELEQLVDGLARLRAFPPSVPTNGL